MTLSQQYDVVAAAAAVVVVVVVVAVVVVAVVVGCGGGDGKQFLVYSTLDDWGQGLDVNWDGAVAVVVVVVVVVVCMQEVWVEQWDAAIEADAVARESLS